MPYRPTSECYLFHTGPEASPSQQQLLHKESRRSTTYDSVRPSSSAISPAVFPAEKRSMILSVFMFDSFQESSRLLISESPQISAVVRAMSSIGFILGSPVLP